MNIGKARYAILPDVGAHLEVFKNMLEKAGVNLATLVIPEGLTIIQLGDLVHKGVEPLECLRLAYNMKQKNGGKYIQILGNHEAHYLGGPDLTGRAGVTHIGVESEELLKHMWREGLMQPAYAAETVDGETLFTHGGLTHTTWLKAGAGDALHTAEKLNTAGSNLAAKINNTSDTELLFKEGKLLTGIVTSDVGVIHPRTGSEFTHSWLQKKSMPFHQIHGHETMKHWAGGDWHDDVPEYVKLLTIVDEVNRYTKIFVGNKYIWSVDPAYGVAPPLTIFPPLVLG